jgi:hypothetical protein
MLLTLARLDSRGRPKRDPRPAGDGRLHRKVTGGAREGSATTGLPDLFLRYEAFWWDFGRRLQIHGGLAK